MGLDTEYVGVPSKVAKMIREAQDFDKVILTYVEGLKKEQKQSIECMDEELVMFKAAAIKTKQQFAAALAEALDANYKVWETFDQDRKTVHSQVEKLRSELLPLKNDMIEINKMLEKLSTYKIHDFVSTVERLSSITPEQLLKIRRLINGTHG